MKNKLYILPTIIGITLAIGIILGRQLANFYISKPPPPLPFPISDIDTVPENPYKVKLGRLIDYIEEDYVDNVNTDRPPLYLHLENRYTRSSRDDEWQVCRGRHQFLYV